MKKVLVISSSPRRGGNSDTLCDKFIQGAISAGNKAEKVFLRDKSIHPCLGCGYCSTNDYSECAKADDMTEILKKMIEADVIVFSTPVYFYTMSGQLKIFIDRMCGCYTKIVNKEFYYIMAAADGSPDAAQIVLSEFKGLMACLTGAREKGYLFAHGVWHKDDVKNTTFPQKAFEMGENI